MTCLVPNQNDRPSSRLPSWNAPAGRVAAWTVGLAVIFGGVLGPATTRVAFAGPPAAPAVSIDWRRPLHDLPPMAWKPREPAGVVASPHGTWLFVAAQHGVSAMWADSGREVWRQATGERVESRPWLADETLYFATVDGQLHALRARSGSAVWPTPARVDATVHGPLTGDATRLYVLGRPGVIAAVERETGKVVWRFHDDVSREFLVEVGGGVLAHGNLVFAGLANGKLLALAKRDGAVVWEVPLGQVDGGPYVDVATTPVHVPQSGGPGWLLVASYNGGLSAVTVADGSTIWRAPGEAMGQPVVARGRIWTVSSRGILAVLDIQNGRTLLSRRLSNLPSGQLALVDDLVLVPGEGGLDLVAQATGRSLARVFDEFGFAAAPFVSGDRLYTVTNGGNALALRLHR